MCRQMCRGKRIRVYSMASGSGKIPPSSAVVLWMCFLVAESTWKCSIKEKQASCILRNLHEVPALPPSITELDLSLNHIGEIHEESFRGLEALQTLKIQQQDVRLVLRKNAFSGLSHLKALDLAYNAELQVDPGAFNGLLRLRILDLAECKLHESILSGDDLRPLVSLEELFLSGNNVRRIRPAPFFSNMSKLHVLDVSHNWINSFCEEDLLHFQGKHFTLFKLSGIKMFHMNPYWDSWSKCGNPFRNMSMTLLDLSRNSFGVDTAVLFFKAIKGTRIHHLDLHSSSSMGKGVWYNNMKDPDRNTFKDLDESGIKALDLSKASIFALKNSVFGDVPDLIELSLAGNSINQIEKDAFNKLGNLQMLNLSDNLLDKIDSETFKHLQSLETLDLSNNNIKTLVSGSFQGLNSLVRLSLSENSLRSLDTIGNLPSLQVLLLENNKITSLHSLPSRTRRLAIVALNYNRINNAESFHTILVEFPEMERIYLGRNTLSWCFRNAGDPVSPQNKVVLIDLETTALQNLWSQGECLDMFEHLHQLQMLFLKGNFLQSLPENIFKGLASLHYLDLSSNDLTYIPDGVFPSSLRTLDLAFNHLGSVDPHAFSTLTAISLRGNQFLCDCGLAALQAWLNRTDALTDSAAEELTCAFPEERRGKPLLSVRLCEDEENEETVERLRLALFVCWTVLVALISGGALISVRLRGYCFKLYRKFVVGFVEGGRKLPAEDNFAYDVYLCFSPEDVQWVTKALLEKLDSQFSDGNELRCCFEARDFLPGEDHLSNMRNAIWRSKKTLCVLSREFLKDGWCLEAFNMAQTKMQKEVRDVLLVLLVDDIPPYRLMKYEPVRSFFQTRRYLCWPEDSQDLEWFYHHLKRRILKVRKVNEVKAEAETNHDTANCIAVTAF